MELCHYTSLGGLQGIISSKSIWATNYSFLNDSTEFTYGLECFEKFLTKANDLEDSSTWVDHLRKVHKYISEVETPEIYTTSFCSNKDLLSQWRGYAQQGVCIVFDQGFINKIGWWCHNPYESWSEAPENLLIPKFDIYHNDVTYIENGAEHTTIDEKLRKIKDAYKNFFTPDISDEIFDESVCPKLFGLTIPFIKHSSFREEAEHRLMVLRVNNPSDLRFRCSGDAIIPYIELSVKEEILPITEVVIGPGGNGSLLEKGLRMMLDHHGYTDVKITHSNIPYRS
ncbi:hypothetical protein PPUN12996_04200 [Pseudomonas putida]|nr:hypothetical protein PPUN12996_04200 [Pseudomonas putida]